MIANLPTVSRTNLLHACVTLTCSTKKYRELKKKTTNQKPFLLLPKYFFFFFLNFQASGFGFVFLCSLFFTKCYVVPSGASSLSAVVQLLTRLLVTSSLLSLTPPSTQSISNLCDFVLPLLMVCIYFFSEPSVLDLQHV